MADNRRTLAMLSPQESGYVRSVESKDRRIRRHIVDMGITPGTMITVMKAAPMGDPIEVMLRGYLLSLRRAELESIVLMDEGEAQNLKAASARISDAKERASHAALDAAGHESNIDSEGHERAMLLTEFILEHGASCKESADDYCPKEVFGGDAPVRLALAGNPNCGKTTLFNAMTGAREYVGNWPGVTVEKKEGKVRAASRRSGRELCTMGHEMTLVDLPGIYSLSPYSMEEMIARDYLIRERPDAIINIVDGTNLERNLYLTVQLLELEQPIIIALNMMDEVEKNGDTIDCKRLSYELGIPVVPISARTGQGIDDLIESAQKLISAAHAQLHEGFHIEPDDVYDDYTHVQHHRIGEIVEAYAKEAKIPLHWAEIKLLEGDERVMEALVLPQEAVQKVRAIVDEYAKANPLGDNESMVADRRYEYIERISKLVLTRSGRASVAERSTHIDKLLTNKWLAIPLFLLIMAGIFTLTFSTVGAFLSDIMGELIDSAFAPWVQGLLTAGGAAGWFISLICDGVIKGVGGVLTFLPQIALLFFCLSLLEDSGYMSRIAFIMDKPMRRFGLSGKSFIPLLMGFGCTVPATMGARATDNERDRRMTILLLPFMSCSAKLPVYGMIAGAFFAQGRGLVIFSLYLLGIVMGILSGFLFKGALFRGDEAPFVIELPPYRMPSARNVFTHVWERVAHFLTKAGTIIFSMSVLIWFMRSFNFSFAMVDDPASSMIGIIGSAIAPIFAPMGFGAWQTAVALITGIIAKEAVVSSLALLYGFVASADNAVVAGALSGTFTPLAAYSFLVFVMLYTPCMAAVATMHRELNSAKLTVFAVAYQILVAYVVSALVYLVGSLFVG